MKDNKIKPVSKLRSTRKEKDIPAELIGEVVNTVMPPDLAAVIDDIFAQRNPKKLYSSTRSKDKVYRKDIMVELMRIGAVALYGGEENLPLEPGEWKANQYRYYVKSKRGTRVAIA